MKTPTPSQAQQASDHLDSLEDLRVSIGKVVRTFESMHSPTAQMIAKLLLMSKEAVGRIDWTVVQRAVLEHDERIDDAPDP